MKFSDFPYFLLHDFLRSRGGNTLSENGVKLGGYRLVGPQKGIVVNSNAKSMDLYIKLTEGYDSSNQLTQSGYSPIGLTFIDTVVEDDNIFGCKLRFRKEIFPGTNLVYSDSPPITAPDYQPQIPIIPNFQGISGDRANILDILNYDTSSLRYSRINYDYQLNFIGFTGLDLIKDDGTTEIYFRKDGSFVSWLKYESLQYYRNQYGIDIDIRKFVNTDKDYLYFGTISQSNISGQYSISYFGMKDYVEECLPYNNRTPNLIECLCDNYIDKQYHSNYHMLKDVWSMVDPYECDERWLDYIGKYYGLNNLGNMGEYKRDFLTKVIPYLKSKGTYSDIKFLYNIISGGNSNVLSITDSWMYNVSYTYRSGGSRFTGYRYSTVTNTLDRSYIIGNEHKDTSYLEHLPYTGMGSRWYYDNYYNSWGPEGANPPIPVAQTRPTYDYASDEFRYPNGSLAKRGYKNGILIDISTVPTDNDEIMSKSFVKGFIDGCEDLRPINKVFIYTPLLSILAHKTISYIKDTNIYGVGYDNIVPYEGQYSNRLSPIISSREFITTDSVYDGLYHNFTIQHDCNTLYPYIGGISYKNANNVYITIPINSYIIEPIDVNTIILKFTNVNYKTIFVNPSSTLTLRIRISKGEITKSVVEDRFMSTKCKKNVGRPDVYSYGYIDVSTGIHHKLFSPVENQGFETQYDYGEYNVEYGNLDYNILTYKGTNNLGDSINTYSINVTEYRRGTTTGTSVLPNTPVFSTANIHIDRTGANITSDIILEELRLYTYTPTVSNDFDLYIKLNGQIYIPRNTIFKAQVKIFSSEANINTYINNVNSQ